MRARVAASVERRGPLLEGVGHAAEGSIEHCARKRFEQSRLEGEIDREMDIGPTLRRWIELPFILEIFEWALDIVDANMTGAFLGHAAGEPLLEGIEADNEVRDQFMLIVRPNTNCADPGQKTQGCRRNAKQGRLAVD